MPGRSRISMVGLSAGVSAASSASSLPRSDSRNGNTVIIEPALLVLGADQRDLVGSPVS